MVAPNLVCVKCIIVLEYSGAFFVSTNTSLVKAAKEFFRDYGFTPIPVAVTDGYLTNLLWLKKPQQASTLPRYLILAQAYAATQPSDHLWQRYLREIRKLRDENQVTEQDYLLLRHELEAKQVLMEVTQGETTAFTAGTPSEVLRRAKDNLLGEVKGQLEEASEEIRRRTAREELQAKSVLSLSTRLAAFVVKPVLWLIIVGLILGALWSSWGLPSVNEGWWRYLISFIASLLALVSVSNVIWGSTVLEVSRDAEVWLARLIESRIKNIFHIQ